MCKPTLFAGNCGYIYMFREQKCWLIKPSAIETDAGFSDAEGNPRNLV
jgi:hypothetical protein